MPNFFVFDYSFVIVHINRKYYFIFFQISKMKVAVVTGGNKGKNMCNIHIEHVCIRNQLKLMQHFYNLLLSTIKQ